MVSSQERIGELEKSLVIGDIAGASKAIIEIQDCWSEFDAALQKADADARAETAQDYARLLSRQPTIPFLAEAIERLKASSD